MIVCVLGWTEQTTEIVATQYHDAAVHHPPSAVHVLVADQPSFPHLFIDPSVTFTAYSQFHRLLPADSPPPRSNLGVTLVLP
jgi:hypothetical protein